VASVGAGRERDGTGLLDGGERGAQQLVARVLTAQAGRLNQRVEEGRHLGAAQRLGAGVGPARAVRRRMAPVNRPSSEIVHSRRKPGCARSIAWTTAVGRSSSSKSAGA
jgi:hypothetical protein